MPPARYLDLTSADAIVDAVHGALDGIIAARLDALTSAPQARALAALGGLVRPAAMSATDPWPELASIPKLFTAPGAQFADYHARACGDARRLEGNCKRARHADRGPPRRRWRTTARAPPKRRGAPFCSPTSLARVSRLVLEI